MFVFFFSSRRRHTRCALVTGVQTCALPICSFFDPSGGWITIAGLRANRMRNVQGVLLGEAVTAARNAANPTVNTSTLATWASEQAQLVARTVDDEEIQAKAAEVVQIGRAHV